jgi:hypothetical protein
MEEFETVLEDSNSFFILNHLNIRKRKEILSGEIITAVWPVIFSSAPAKEG